jgi:hypothetical protein
MVMFGGSKSVTGTGNAFNEVWTLSLAGSPNWTPLATTGSPPSARYGQVAIYDPVRDRMLVFGGTNVFGPLNDVWELTLAGSPTWLQLAPIGLAPSPRFWHTAVYDAAADRMLVFGGEAAGSTPQNDVWTLSLSGSPTWTQLTPLGTPPSARRVASAVYDLSNNRMLMFGGLGAGYTNDVWQLSLTGSPAWTLVTPTGTPPSARGFHAATYEPASARMLVFGGLNPGPQNDVWALSLTPSPAWSQLAVSGTPPSGRGAQIVVHDPAHDRMIVFGGFASTSMGDLWTLSLAGSPTWSRLTDSAPGAIRSHSLIYDPVRNRVLLFGGLIENTLTNGVWALSLSGTQGWTQLSPTGTPPSARYKHTAIYDPVRDRMIVFGGNPGVINNLSITNEVWALSLAGTTSWTQLTPTAPPPAGRVGHSAIYDPVRDRMLVFAGMIAPGYPNNELWSLSLAGSPSWTNLTVSSGPAANYGNTAIYDPGHDRLVVFDGVETWSATLAAAPVWTQVLGVSPSSRAGHVTIHDPVRNRMVVFAGSVAVPFLNDSWALSLGDSPVWTQLAPADAPPVGRRDAAAVYDPTQDRMLSVGGYNSDGSTFTYLGDQWSLQWASALGVPPHPAALALQLAPAYPNPARGDIQMEFDLPAANGTSLRVYDVSGRIVRTLLEGPLPAGKHSIRWDRRSTSGASVQPGLYFYELRAGTHSVSRRVAVVE